jgi:hypothetical protein
METQHIPAFIAKDAKGDTYARVAPTRFPRNSAGDAPLVHRITAYSQEALWDGVDAWFAGGAPVTGTIDPKASKVHPFESRGGATWRIYPPDTAREQRAPLAWNSFATPVALDEMTYGYKWSEDLVTKSGALITLPEYFRLEKDAAGKERWAVVSASDVPAETGLAKAEFHQRRGPDRRPYVTPEEADSPWKKPGPTAGPFEAKLGDGSVVTYWWYRFADQPALINADMTKDEREALQKRVEMLHRNWTKDREYLAPPTVGKLANLDPAVLVTPPKGLEIGYVPIVTRQGAAE